MSTERIGVVLLNLGGPESLAEVRSFLRRLLADPQVVSLPWPLQPALARLIARLRSKRACAHYRAIGGRSPMAAQTREQVEALRTQLGKDFVVRYAFRHSPPFADSVVAALAAARVRRLVALPAYPQWSGSTSGSALAALDRAARSHDVQLCRVSAYPDAPGYIEALAARVCPLLADGAHLIISAHGLPERQVRRGDPYVDHVRRTLAALTARLPSGTTYSLAFQSRLGPIAWTRPYLSDEVRRLAASGVRSLVVAPVSFACENLETLYELDIELANLARDAGIASFGRAPAPGCHPAFVDALTSLVRRAVRQAGWETGFTSSAAISQPARRTADGAEVTDGS